MGSRAMSNSSSAAARASKRIATTCIAHPPIVPARTCSEAAAQARSALRRLREAAASGETVLQPGQQQARLTVRLPLPSPEWQDDLVRAFDQGDWPGGIQQRFRRLRPLIEEHFLSGYDPQFVGMLESPADGIGVWRAGGGAMTVVCQVGNLNFAPFARLCAGEFGSSVLDPQHTLIAVNPTWTKSSDIGQLWDRKLKAQAAALIDDASAWLPLYHLWDVRTAKGATGLLFRSWPHDWQLYSTCGQGEEEEEEGLVAALGLEPAPIIASLTKPSKEEQIAALNAALAGQQQEAKERKQQQGWFKL